MKTIILITLLALFSFSIQTLKKGRGNGGFLFYSIDINDEGKLFKEIIIPALSEINQNNFSDELDDILNSLSTNKQGDFKIPNNLHITTYYKGRNPIDNENKAVKEFKNKQEVEVRIKGVVYVPGNAVIAYAETDYYSDNKHQHITILTINGFKPASSNDVLDNLEIEKFNSGFYNLPFSLSKEEAKFIIFKDYKTITGYMGSH